MSQVCITVATLIGLHCAPNATPPHAAECWYTPDLTYCHVRDPTTLPALVSFYVPADGGINCDGDCSVLGDMTPVNECENCAACPLGMYWSWINLAGHEYQCRDHGSAVTVRYGERYTADGFRTKWFIIFDVLAVDGIEPPNAYELVEWSVSE